MKKIWLVLVLSLSGFASYSQFSKASLQATGLTCAMCSNAINKALQKISFVESVSSDIKNSAFNIVFRQNEQVNIDALKNAVEDAGFSVGSFKLIGVFKGVKLEKDSHVKIENNYFHFLNGEGKILDGEQVLTVVDKSFVSEKQFKKFSSSSKMSCVLTGKASGSCSVNDGIAEGERIYHIML